MRYLLVICFVVFCQTSLFADPIVDQDFDLATTWTYTPNPEARLQMPMTNGLERFRRRRRPRPIHDPLEPNVLGVNLMSKSRQP